jgi:hypothetical protein
MVLGVPVARFEVPDQNLQNPDVSSLEVFYPLLLLFVEVADDGAGQDKKRTPGQKTHQDGDFLCARREKGRGRKKKESNNDQNAKKSSEDGHALSEEIAGSDYRKVKKVQKPDLVRNKIVDENDKKKYGQNENFLKMLEDINFDVIHLIRLQKK